MNELQIFNNPEFGEMRMIDIGNKHYFVGADVARALGYAKPENAISQHCKGTLKRGILTKGGKQTMNVIPEGDLYRLVANSQLPKAQEFESWVFDEVLPTIRKTGSYSNKQSPDKSQERDIRLKNARTREAHILLKVADSPDTEPLYRRVLHSKAVELVSGEKLLPMPVLTEPTYTATQIAEMCSISSANMVGKISNRLNLKAPEGESNEYGHWIHDKSQHSNKQVKTWVYTRQGLDMIQANV